MIETHAPVNRKSRLVSRDTRRKESFASFKVMVTAKRYHRPLPGGESCR
jgi:hypothetical protein